MEAVAELAALISLCAQLRADRLPGDGEAWAATAAKLGDGRESPPELVETALASSPAARGVASGRASLAAKTAAEEGKDVIEAMLVVGLIFLGVIVLGELTKWLRHRH